MSKQEKKYLSGKELENLHVVSRDFSRFLQQRFKEQEKYNLEDEQISQGVDLGIRSVLLLLSGLLLDEKGLIQKDKIETLLENVKNRESGKAF